MKHAFFLRPAVLALAAALALAACAPEDEDPDTRETLVCFGNSLTEGYNAVTYGEADKSKSYPAFLQKKIPGMRVINAGVSGDTTASGLERLESDVLAYSPRAVIIELGANDLLERIKDGLPAEANRQLEYLLFHPKSSDITMEEITGTVLPEMTANLQAIIDGLKAEGRPVFVSKFYTKDITDNILSRATKIEEAEYQRCFEAYEAAYAALEGAEVLAGEVVWDGVWDGEGTMSLDTIHPTAAGYERMAANYYSAIQNTLLQH